MTDEFYELLSEMEVQHLQMSYDNEENQYTAEAVR